MVIEMFKAIADENRLKILKILSQGKLCACDILENMDLSQPTVSHHLKILQQAGLITVEKKGRWNYYSIIDEKIEEMQTLLESIRNKEIDIKVKKCDSDCDGTREG
ncbi:metalloregulator ArsR/SmtB family transcription factor [Clostridiaceae bacterium 35-E11]